MSFLLLLDSASPPGADISFNGPMLALPYSLQRLGFTYTRNSLKTVYQGGSLVTLAANQFGTTYDSVTGLHAFEAEPAATNLATNSAGAAATWIVSGVTDAGTPISGFANSLAFGSNSVDRYAYKSISITNTVVYTVSIFVEMDDGTAPVVGGSSTTGDFGLVGDGDLLAGGALITRIGSSNVYRVSRSFTSATTGSRYHGVVKYTGSTARTFRVIGIQVETGARATSYIATAGSTATRAADVLSTTTANLPGFNAAGYTLAVDFRKDIAGSVSTVALEVDDNSANNRAFIGCDSTNTVLTFTRSGGVTQASVVEVAFSTLRQRAAYSNSVNSFLRAVSGTAGTSDSLGAMPVSPTHLFVGCRFAGADQLNGFIYSFKLITVALNQAQTTALTS